MMQKELEEVKGSLYIMISTLNQMVNYIPYKYFSFSTVWNITTDDAKNKNWDTYYQKVSDTQIHKHIEFQYSDILKINQIEKRIKQELKLVPNNKIFWNITGGQRPFVLAIHNLIKSDELKDKIHYLCYLEGNKGEMRIMKFENGILSDDVTNSYSYQIEGLTIDIALELMGFRQKESEVRENLLGNYNQSKRSFYNTFYKDYCKSPELRQLLPDFNKSFKGKDKVDTERSIINNFNEVINEVSKYTIATVTELRNQWTDFIKVKAFGYILEEMTVNLIFEAIENNRQIKENTASLYASTQINAEYFKKDKRHIDEFDILLLTKTGQLINFECKSGSMSGDNAKSTNYSTYAISGVYGLPILITPQIDIDDKINKNITIAVNAAKRANLNIWYLKEIEEKLKERLTK